MKSRQLFRSLFCMRYSGMGFYAKFFEHAKITRWDHCIKWNQTNYFIVRPKVEQRAGQLNLPHLGITKTENIELKHKTDEQISPMNGLEPWDQSDRQKQTKVEDKISWKGRFWAQSETVKKWWKVIAKCSKSNRHVQMKVAERGMSNLDEEFWVM